VIAVGSALTAVIRLGRLARRARSVQATAGAR